MSRSPRSAFLVWGAACVMVIALIAWMADHSRTFETKSDPRNDNYNLLVQGFREGHLSVKLPIPTGFAHLRDPMDPVANEKYRLAPYWLHDLSYYRGKLYLYFGAAPAISLFWPWVALTGHYLPHRFAVAIFCIVGFLAGVRILAGLQRRYFPEVPSGVAVAGALTLGLGAGTPILLQRAEFWEVAVSGAGAMVMLALTLIGSSVHRPNRRALWLLLGSLAYGLAIGARPSVLFGAAILLAPIGLAWRDRSTNQSHHSFWAAVAAAVIPITLCGVGIIIYNYLRFASPFQFGEQYQLAADRQDAVRHFSIAYLWFNFRIYFFARAHWDGFFPFVGAIVPPPAPSGHAPVESAFGVLTNIPVLWLSLAVPLAWRNRDPFERAPLRVFLGSAIWLFATSALIVCLFYGSCWRYEMEFLPILALLAVIGIFSVERALADHNRLRVLARIIWISLFAYSIVFNLLAGIDLHASELDRYAVRLAIVDGRLAEAAAQLKTALSIKPRFERADSDLADTLVRSDDFVGAIHYYEKALECDPSSAWTHYRLACVLETVGRPKEAVLHLEQALKIESELFNAKLKATTELIKTRGFSAEAFASQVEAYQIGCSLANAHVALGVVLARIPARLHDAITQYQAALAIQPDNVSAHNNLGILYARLGRWDEAFFHFETALKIDPSYETARENLMNLTRFLPAAIVNHATDRHGLGGQTPLD